MGTIICMYIFMYVYISTLMYNPTPCLKKLFFLVPILPLEDITFIVVRELSVLAAINLHIVGKRLNNSQAFTNRVHVYMTYLKS